MLVTHWKNEALVLCVRLPVPWQLLSWQGSSLIFIRNNKAVAVAAALQF